MILDASAGGPSKSKLTRNECIMSHDRNEKTPGIIKVDKEVAYKVEMELLKRQLAEKETKEVSVKQVEAVCDFCLEDHPNESCLSGGSTEEVNYMGNQKNDLFSNSYNQGWRKHSNFSGETAILVPQCILRCHFGPSLRKNYKTVPDSALC
jgi:hypothetical protein